MINIFYYIIIGINVIVFFISIYEIIGLLRESKKDEQRALSLMEEQVNQFKKIEYASNINILHVLHQVERKEITIEEAEERIKNSLNN